MLKNTEIKKIFNKNEGFSEFDIELINEALRKYISGQTKKEYDDRLKIHGYKPGYILIEAQLDEIMIQTGKLHETWLQYKMKDKVETSSRDFDKAAQEKLLGIAQKIKVALNTNEDDLVLYRHEADDRFPIGGPIRFRLAVPEKYLRPLQDCMEEYKASIGLTR